MRSRTYKLYVRAVMWAGLLVVMLPVAPRAEDFEAGTRMNALAEEHTC